MPTKFTVFDKETASEIKNILKNKKRNFSQKNSDKSDFRIAKIPKDTVTKSVVTDIMPVTKAKPKRPKLTKEQKAKKKASRTPAEQAKIDARMAKLRELRNARKK